MSECRVHSCVFQQRVAAKKAQPDPLRNCKCRQVVSQVEADQLIKWGEAVPQVIARERKEQYKPCRICEDGDTKSSCSFCKRTGKILVVEINEVFGRDVVRIPHQTKTNRVSTPRAPAIESKHIHRANVSRDVVELVAAAQRSLWGDGVEFVDSGLVFVQLGYTTPQERKHAQERIDEYGMMILKSRAFPGPSECKHRKEFKCSRCEVPAGEKVNVIGVEPEDDMYKAEGRTYDWGRAI